MNVPNATNRMSKELTQLLAIRDARIRELEATLSTMREEYLHLRRVTRSARDLLSGEFYAEALGELYDALDRGDEP